MLQIHISSNFQTYYDARKATTIAGILEAEFASDCCAKQNGGLSRVIITENERRITLVIKCNKLKKDF